MLELYVSNKKQRKKKNFIKIIEKIIKTEIRLNKFLISSQCVLITNSDNIALKRWVIII